MNAAALARRTGASGKRGQSGRLRAAFGGHQALRPGPKRTRRWPGRSSVKPKRRSVSMCTKISGVPSPRVRKPNPRSRLNHLTGRVQAAGRRHDVVRGGGNCAGSTAVDSSIERMRKACRPFGRCSTSHDHARAFIGGLVSVAAQAGHVQKNVGQPVIGNDEAITLGDVEPLDDAGHSMTLAASSPTSLPSSRRSSSKPPLDPLGPITSECHDRPNAAA